MRIQERSQVGPEVPVEVSLPEEEAAWFPGDNVEWQAWTSTGKARAEYPMWRRTYLDGRLRGLRQQHKVRLSGGVPLVAGEDATRKRARGSNEPEADTAGPEGSGTGSPPAIDEPGSASSTINTTRIGTGETSTSSGKKGGKRRNTDGDGEQSPVKQAKSSSAPAQSGASASTDPAPATSEAMDQGRASGHKRSIDEAWQDDNSWAAAGSSINSQQPRRRWNNRRVAGD